MGSLPGMLTGRIFGAGALAGDFPGAALAFLRHRFAAALEEEWDLRRFFLWLPAAAGAGAIFYLLAPTEPVMWIVGSTGLLFAVLAYAARGRQALLAVFAGVSAMAAGEFSGAGARRGLTRPFWSVFLSARSRALSKRSIIAARARAFCCA